MPFETLVDIFLFSLFLLGIDAAAVTTSGPAVCPTAAALGVMTEEPWAQVLGILNPYDDVEPWRSCSQSFEAAIETFQGVNDKSVFLTVTNGASGMPAVDGPRTGTDLYTAMNGKTGPSVFTWTASAPCCSTCFIGGGNVQVYYWPSSTSTTSAPSNYSRTAVGNQTTGPATATNSAGFTFTSPSIYVGFESLSATDLCGDVGTRITRTTLAFAPNEMSTSIGYRWNTTAYSLFPPGLYGSNGPEFTSADWAKSVSCGPHTSSFWQFYSDKHTRYSNMAAASAAVISSFQSELGNSQCTQLLGDMVWSAFEQGQNYTVTYDLCSPTISVPQPILTLNPIWSNCVAGVSGFYDPPTALTAGTAAFVSTGIFAPSSATPGPSPAPATATQTPAPATQVPTQPTATAADPPASPIASSTRAQQTPASSPPSSQLATSVPVSADPASNPIPVTSPQLAQTTIPGSSTPVIVSVPPQVTIDGSTITADSSSALIIASQTLTPGGVITHSGTALSLASNGGTLVVGGSSTQPLASSALVLGGSQTIVAGAAPVTVSGTPISLQAGGSNIVLGSSTVPVSALVSNPTPATGPNIRNIGDTASPTYVVGTQTLIPGASALVVSGTSISLQPGASSVVIGSQILPISAVAALPTSVIVGGQTQALTAYLAGITGEGSLVSGGSTQAFSITIGSNGSPSIIAGGQTEALTAYATGIAGAAGASIVIGGSTMPVSAFVGKVTSGVDVVVGGKTTSETGVGQIIATMGGFGQGTNPTKTYVQVGASGVTGANGTFVGGAKRVGWNGHLGTVSFMLGISVVLLAIL